MIGFLKRVFGRTTAHSGAGEDTPSSLPIPGQIWSFRTRPYTEFSPSPTGRFAAFKIIGVSDNYVVIAVLDGVWPDPPTPSEVKTARVLNEHRFAHTGRPAAFGVLREWWKPTSELDDFGFVVLQQVTKQERSYFDAVDGHAVGSRTARLLFANYAAEGEWRWANDRENIVKETEAKDAKNAAKLALEQERYRTRLSKLTFDQLLTETHFKRWESSPPFPPEEFTRAAREVIRQACIELRDLGVRPRRADVRAILKRTVDWFNKEDEKAGGVIETEEREDIYTILEEMAHAARQKALVDEIDEWRDW